jgi:hypothetical protein
MVKFMIGFTIGFIIVGMTIHIAKTAQHNLELYIMEDQNDTRN